MHSKFGHRAQPIFNYRANLPGFLHLMGPTYYPYGLRWEIQKLSGEVYDIQCNKRSKNYKTCLVCWGPLICNVGKHFLSKYFREPNSIYVQGVRSPWAKPWTICYLSRSNSWKSTKTCVWWHRFSYAQKTSYGWSVYQEISGFQLFVSFKALKREVWPSLWWSVLKLLQNTNKKVLSTSKV